MRPRRPRRRRRRPGARKGRDPPSLGVGAERRFRLAPSAHEEPTTDDRATDRIGDSAPVSGSSQRDWPSPLPAATKRGKPYVLPRTKATKATATRAHTQTRADRDSHVSGEKRRRYSAPRTTSVPSGGQACCTNGRRELRLQASAGFLATKARRARLIRARRRDLLPPRSDHARTRCCAVRLQRDAGKPAVRRCPSPRRSQFPQRSLAAPLPDVPSRVPISPARSQAVGETPRGGRRTRGVLLEPRPPFGILGPRLTSRPPSR